MNWLLRKLTWMSIGLACSYFFNMLYLFLSTTSSQQQQSERDDYAVGVLNLPTLPEVAFFVANVSSAATGILWQSSHVPNSASNVLESFVPETETDLQKEQVVARKRIDSFSITPADNSDAVIQPSNRPNANGSTTNSDSRCFPHNSKAWLEGIRIGNVPLTGSQAYTAINDHPLLEQTNWQPILQQSLCHKQSLLLKNEEISNKETESAIFAWTVRLIYLAIHHHQHRDALQQEAIERRKQTTEQCENELLAKGIGLFDYECKEGKFLISGLPSHGLGSVMRIDAVNFMLGGLASNRTVLFVNNVEGLENATSRLQFPWDLVSCERKDHQCFYQPMSPCVVTKEDLAGAYIVGGRMKELSKLAQHEKHRVIVAAVSNNFMNVPGNVPGYLRDIANTLIDGLPKEDPRIPILRLAAEAILKVDEHNSGDYKGSQSVIQRAILMYIMRPSYEQAEKLESIMEDVVPDDFNYSVALGLPIRGT
jgi:hypothetical protein